MKPPDRPPAATDGNRGRRQAEIRRRLAEGLGHHRHGRLAAAAAAYRRVLALDPGQPDALHLAGQVALGEGDLAGAAALVERAIATNPAPAAFHNSLGVIRLGQGNAAAALALFEQALVRDPLLAEAYLNQGNALQMLGRLGDAVAAYDRALAVRAEYPEALAGQGRALHRQGQPGLAVAQFRRALACRPDWPKVLRWQGDSLAATGDRAAAEQAFAAALALAPDDAETLAALAAFEEKRGRLDAALAHADRALVHDPGEVRAALAAARVLRRQGRIDAGLARLAPFADAESNTPAAGEAAEALALVHFERGMLFDRAEDAAAAHAAFSLGHQRMQAAAPPTAADVAFFPDLIRRLGERFAAGWVADWTAAAAADPALPADPVFLIGFPRSGTTLLDQLLDAHPALVSLEEKDMVDVVRRRVQAMPGGYPDALAALAAADQQALRRLYWEEAARHLGGALPPGRRLVDKMPLNTIDVGLIHRLFPEARFLLALRHPADVVLSNFMQAFQPNAAMLHARTLTGAARFYAAVMGLWQQYARVLPIRWQAVRYEDLVADLEAEAKLVLAFLDLPWDDRILAYRERAAARSIATPSYHQVVEPVYRRAVGRWQRYAPFLAEATPLLAPFLAAFDYGGEDGADAPLP